METTHGLSDRELAMLLQQQELPHILLDSGAFLRERTSLDHEASRDITSSSATSRVLSHLPRVVLRVLGPAGGRRVHYPFLAGPGCFGAALGGCGGSVMWALGDPSGCCFCVAFGALVEAMMRKTQPGDRSRRWSSADEDSSSDEDVFCGLDAATIERTTVVSTAEQKTAVVGGTLSDEHCKCMICVELFVKDDKLRTLPCLHRYHRHCIDEWLRRSPLCPICKHDVTDNAASTSLGSATGREGSGAPGTRVRRRPWFRTAARTPSASSRRTSPFHFQDALEATR